MVLNLKLKLFTLCYLHFGDSCYRTLALPFDPYCRLHNYDVIADAVCTTINNNIPNVCAFKLSVNRTDYCIYFSILGVRDVWLKLTNTSAVKITCG